MMDDAYVALLNGVLAVNYYGEVLTVEILSRLLGGAIGHRYRDLLARQLLDETRHANITRKLMLERGRDPLRDARREDFTFYSLFREFADRDEETLAFLGENEALSARNFNRIIGLAREAEDSAVVSMYSEILNDEVNHSTALFKAIPNDAATAAVRATAKARMRRALSFPYLQLFTAFPHHGA
jgi:hypothetical protein